MTTLTRIVWLVMLFASLTGCQGPTVSPEQQTSTAEAEAVAHHIATLGSIAATETAVQPAASPVPTATATITSTPDPFPTPVIGAIYVAEQRFESGWMLWLQPNAQIWVLTADFSGNNIWTVYNDTFVDGEVEFDPQLVAPENRHQPVRGFGKLWRENLEVRQIMGWALELEMGHTTRYEYRQGGHLDENNEYVPAPGYHLVESVSGDTFRFNEENFSWEIVS